MGNFILDAKLEADSFFITDLTLCQLRLINNSRYPWLILVPKLEGISEITDLSIADYDTLNQEIRIVALAMQQLFKPNKLNIASIGNIVRQFHMHVIARYHKDLLFPKPVWGSVFVPYDQAVSDLLILKISHTIATLIIK